MDRLSQTLSTESSFSAKKLAAVDSNVELVIITIYLLVCFLAALFGNGTILTVVFRNRALHMPHYYLLCSYIACDIATCLYAYPVMVVVMFQGTELPEWLCRSSGCLSTAAFFCSIYLLGLLAYERYHFFCRPMSYQRTFATFRLVCLVVGAWLIALSFSISTEILLGRKVYITVLGCQLESSRVMSQIQIAGFFGPSLFLVFFSTIRVGILLVKMRAMIAPQILDQGNGNTSNPDQIYLPIEGLSNTYKIKISKAGAAFKLVILISGLFWGTYIPGFIVRLVIFSSGITWEEIESRQNLTAMILLRSSHLIIVTIPQVLNPWLYLYTHPELKVAVKDIRMSSLSF